jgi:putative ABC transport system ATP-binding protein
LRYFEDNPAILEARSVSKIFPRSAHPVRALHEISISFRAGEFAIIKGPSGSGKTTLLSILGCLLSPSAGDVRILGEWASRMNDRRRRMLRLQRIGFIFQNFNLLDALNARENVALPQQLLGNQKKRSLEKADALLKNVGLEGRLDFQIRDLSQGERQRVAVARAFMNDPVIILADEPSASVDSANGREIMSLLKNFLTEEKLVVVATHDERIIEAGDKLVSMDDGQVTDFEAHLHPPAKL